MTVTVTQKHINDGDRYRHRSFYNPIALALAESDRFAVVTDSMVHLVTGRFVLPSGARAWLFDFNLGRRVYPTSFEL